MEYKIVFSNRKTLGIQINTKGELIVRAPHGVSKKLINQVIQEKEDWILDKLGSMKQYGFSFSDGDSVLFLGEKYSLSFNQVDKVMIEGGTLVLPQDMDIERFKNWLKFQADKVIKRRFKELSLDYNYKNVRLSNAKTRYGSCNSKGNINLSWRLIFCPEFVIDYVIIHELEHLNHMNHSKFFWNAVEKKMPDYKIAKKWLKENNVMSLL